MNTGVADRSVTCYVVQGHGELQDGQQPKAKPTRQQGISTTDMLERDDELPAKDGRQGCRSKNFRHMTRTARRQPNPENKNIEPAMSKF